jgi:hypothetical protein
MDSNTFKCEKIYEMFKRKWIISFSLKIWELFCCHGEESVNQLWKNYINALDLGIVSVSFYEDTYKIIDEKKWIFSKIKYGF